MRSPLPLQQNPSEEFLMSGTYTDLQVWQAAMDLAEDIYRITKTFPKEETYGLAIQVAPSGSVRPQQHRRRQGPLVRQGTRTVPLPFPRILVRDRDQINLSRRLGYMNAQQEEAILQKTARIGQLLNGLLRAFRSPAAA
jgi:hypothetical protein